MAILRSANPDFAMKISDVLQHKGSDVVAMSPSTPVTKAARLLSEQSIGAAIVTDSDGTVIGLLSERDISRGLGEHGLKIGDMCIGDLMSGDVITCDLDWTASAALEVMLAHNFRHLPVLDNDGEVFGIVSMRDMAAMGVNNIGWAIQQAS
jgi:CBS domain-containing protein